jgi:hypothetical protein
MINLIIYKITRSLKIFSNFHLCKINILTMNFYAIHLIKKRKFCEYFTFIYHNFTSSSQRQNLCRYEFCREI